MQHIEVSKTKQEHSYADLFIIGCQNAFTLILNELSNVLQILKVFCIHAVSAILYTCMYLYTFGMGIQQVNVVVTRVMQVFLIAVLSYSLTSLLPIVVVGLVLCALFGQVRFAYAMTGISCLYAFFTLFLI